MALNISESDIAKIVENVISSLPSDAKPKVSEPQREWDSTQYMGRKFIGVYSDKLYAQNLVFNHSVYSIVTAAADTDNLYGNKIILFLYTAKCH